MEAKLWMWIVDGLGCIFVKYLKDEVEAQGFLVALNNSISSDYSLSAKHDILKKEKGGCCYEISQNANDG